MRKRVVLKWLSTLLASLALLALGIAFRSKHAPIALIVIDQAAAEGGGHLVRLLITNTGPYVVYCHPGFRVFFRGTQMPLHVEMDSVLLEPEAATEVAINLPSLKADWFGSINYVEENVWTQAKLKFRDSAFGESIFPPQWISFQGAEARTPWIIKLP